MYLLYRAGLVVWQLGWVDLDLGRSPGWWAATVATQAEWWNIPNLSQPNQGIQVDGGLCVLASGMSIQLKWPDQVKPPIWK